MACRGQQESCGSPLATSNRTPGPPGSLGKPASQQARAESQVLVERPSRSNGSAPKTVCRELAATAGAPPPAPLHSSSADRFWLEEEFTLPDEDQVLGSKSSQENGAMSPRAIWYGDFTALRDTWMCWEGAYHDIRGIPGLTTQQDLGPGLQAPVFSGPAGAADAATWVCSRAAQPSTSWKNGRARLT